MILSKNTALIWGTNSFRNKNPILQKSYVRVANIWNSLPKWVVSANTTDTFKAAW